MSIQAMMIYPLGEKMIPAMRQQQIMHHLNKKRIAGIGELTALLQVSHMTVRRDIQKLEEEGRVVSVTGGVSLATRISGEPPHRDKRGMRRREKEAIARVAAGLISDESTIYLDAGTTTLTLARRLAELKRSWEEVLFVTNDLVIAQFLAERVRCRLFFTGGMVDMENRSCVGEGAATPLKNLNIDLAFISTPSWNLRWLSIPDQNKALVKKAVVDSSARRILLSDSSKYGKKGAFKAVPLSVFDAVVTDTDLPETARAALIQQGIVALLAEGGA